MAPFMHNPWPLRVKYGERVQFTINNFSPDPHAMHLHGHHFQVVSVDGVEHEGAMRDTVMLPGGCHTAVIVFEANNPGVHEFHCHMMGELSLSLSCLHPARAGPP
jgi:FtsP/CotA-like multicopper oxidase with cupredoxin domain